MSVPHRRTGLLGAVLAALAGTLLVLPTTPAPAVELPFPYPTMGQPPAGANDWDCEPTRRRPHPVILVHGTFGDQKSLLDPISLAIKNAGFCVFAVDYGNRATGPVEESARQLKRFTDRVLRATGAEKVSMVGHSQGGMMPRYYIKHLGGDRRVVDLVGLAPSNHGTDRSRWVPSMETFCYSCAQQATGSEFLTDLNAGDETPGPVHYTQIVTEHDEVVVPYTSGFLRGPRSTNIVLQDSCPLDPAEHLLIPMSRTAIGWTLDALRRRGPADPEAAVGCG